MENADAQEKRERRYWAFQANPQKYDIERAVEALTYDTWTTERSDVRAGDRALIWKSLGGSPVRGVVAFAEVLDDPSNLLPDTTYWIGDPEPQRELRVPIRYVVPGDCPVWVTVETQPILETLSVWSVRGTVFHVTPDQWRAVVELAGGWPSPTDREVQDHAEELVLGGTFDVASVIDGRARVVRSVALRQGQPAFRTALIEAYGGACAISGCAVPEVLEAAHITPYRGPDTNHISNGLLLRADLHSLFDLGLIAIHPETLAVEIAEVLIGTEYGSLAGHRLRTPDAPEAQPSAAALGQHRLVSQID